MNTKDLANYLGVAIPRVTQRRSCMFRPLEDAPRSSACFPRCDGILLVNAVSVHPVPPLSREPELVRP